MINALLYITSNTYRKACVIPHPVLKLHMENILKFEILGFQILLMVRIFLNNAKNSRIITATKDVSPATAK